MAMSMGVGGEVPSTFYPNAVLTAAYTAVPLVAAMLFEATANTSPPLPPNVNDFLGSVRLCLQCYTLLSLLDVCTPLGTTVYPSQVLLRLSSVTRCGIVL
jgi:hypothetical protein